MQQKYWKWFEFKDDASKAQCFHCVLRASDIFIIIILYGRVIAFHVKERDKPLSFIIQKCYAYALTNAFRGFILPIWHCML